MGHVTAIGPCITCGERMTFNPVRVPSLRIDGRREPVCRRCIETANPVRKKHGLPEIVIHPDAYEACDEQELD